MDGNLAPLTLNLVVAAAGLNSLRPGRSQNLGKGWLRSRSSGVSTTPNGSTTCSMRFFCKSLQIEGLKRRLAKKSVDVSV